MIYEVQAMNQKDADVAQVVAHLIGSEEVTGPSPVISSENKREVLIKRLPVFVIWKGEADLSFGLSVVDQLDMQAYPFDFFVHKNDEKEANWYGET